MAGWKPNPTLEDLQAQEQEGLRNMSDVDLLISSTHYINLAQKRLAELWRRNLADIKLQLSEEQIDEMAGLSLEGDPVPFYPTDDGE